MDPGFISAAGARVVSASLYTAMGIGVGVVGALLALLQPLLSLMGAPPHTPMFIPARQYLYLRAISAPAVLLNFALQGSFRGLRDSRSPVNALIVATLVNIALDTALILPSPVTYGVRGAAVATVVAQWAAVAVLFRTLSQRVQCIRTSPPRQRSQDEGSRNHKDRKHAHVGTTRAKGWWSRPSPLLALPSQQDMSRVLRAGALLTLRTMCTVVTLYFSTSKAARLSTAQAGGSAAITAAHQIAFQLWLFPRYAMA